jgi:hypothetical protein
MTTPARARRWIAIGDAVAQSRETFTRFPVAMLVAVTCAIFALVMIDTSGPNDWDLRVVTLALAIPLCYVLTVYAERHKLSSAARIGVSALGVVPVIAFYIPLTTWSNQIATTRWAHFNISLHLLVAFLPFVAAGTLRGFWQYNRILFLRFLLATLYTFVLFAGLSIAVLAIDNLFGVDVRGETYGQLLALLGFVFHPWFFLAGVPADLEALDGLEEYPIGLKIFAQFVLIPLVTVYIIILTAYLVRVVITTTWPSGWIGWLVSSVAAAGTLALLLVHPIRQRDDSRWVDVYGRWFYVALVPSIVMLLMAIWLRINKYGFTEQRYLLMVLALWLAGIALFFGVTGSRNIKTIPLTLCVVGLLTLTGPWSAYAVSRSSQVNRFRSILDRYGMLVDGRVRAAEGTEVAEEDRRELSAVLRYLVRTHGARSLARIDPMYSDSIVPDYSDPTLARVDEPNAHRVMVSLGLPYVNQWEGQTADYFFHQSEAFGTSVDVRGFELLVPAELNRRTAIAIDGDSLVFAPLERDSIVATWQGEQTVIATVSAIRARVDSAGESSSPRAPNVDR